jgi:hypothetical protein
MEVVGAIRPNGLAMRFFQPGSAESSAGDERTATSGFGRAVSG